MSDAKSLLAATNKDLASLSLEERQAQVVQELTQVDPDYQLYLEKLNPRRIARIHRQVSRTRNGLYTIAPSTCLEPDAPVTMADGTLKSISLIERGESVIDVTGSPTLVTDIMCRQYEGAMFRFKYGSGCGRRWTPWMTADHRLLVNGVYERAANIKKKDLLHMPESELEEISEVEGVNSLRDAAPPLSKLSVSVIETRYSTMDVYDIETESHSFLIQGIVSHNCLGPTKCLFIEQCPIPDRGPGGEIITGDINDYPMYRPCVFEMLYMQQKVIDYMQHLKVDPENPIEMALVNDLGVIDLYKNRAMLIMSGGDKEGDGRDFLKRDMMEQQGEHGTLTSTQTQLHPVAGYLDVLEKRRGRLIDALMETRRGKLDKQVKLGQGRQDSALRDELVAVRKALEAAVGTHTVGLKKEELLLIDDD